LITRSDDEKVDEIVRSCDNRAKLLGALVERIPFSSMPPLERGNLYGARSDRVIGMGTSGSSRKQAGTKART
jgi:hypothetical protein